MTTVRDLIAKKGNVVHSISPRATVFSAISKMVDENVGSLVVRDGVQLPIGIFTERDYLKRVALEGRTSKTTFVVEVMTPDPVLVDVDSTAEDCMKVMTARRVRHLPVIGDDLDLAGMLSIGDIVGHLANERQSQIDELTSYIQGKYA